MFSFFLLFLLVGFIIHLLIRHFFKKRNFVDAPDGIKKQHEMAVPISGGLSFGLSYYLFVFVCLLIFYIDKVLVHMWEEPKKMDDPEVIKAAFEESGFDSEKLMNQMQDPEVKAKLISNTEQAVERGVFGIPTFFIDDQIYFGKDTIWMIEEILES